jgi:hypothetical protein
MDSFNDYFFRPCVLFSFCFRLNIDVITGAASFTIYTSTKEVFRDRQWLTRDSIVDVSCIGGISGAMSGALISFGSARELSTV